MHGSTAAVCVQNVCKPAAPVRARKSMEVAALSTTGSQTKRKRAAGKSAAGRKRNGDAAGQFVPGPEFTPNMIAKARRLVNSGLFHKVDKGVCQVASSDGSSYLASTGPNNCQCVSFKIRRVCSHVLVVMIVDAAGDGGPVPNGGGEQ